MQILVQVFFARIVNISQLFRTGVAHATCTCDGCFKSRYLECVGGAWSASITTSVLDATWLMSTTSITILRELTVAIPGGMFSWSSLPLINSYQL